MGCDIHAFAEFAAGGAPYMALSDGAFWLPRDYDLFAALAGVRSEEGFVPLHAPRGIPPDVSQHVADRYFVPVMEDERALAWGVGDHYTPALASQLVVSGSSKWWESGTTAPLTPGTNGHVSNADWHSASWLLVDELHAALHHARYALSEGPWEFQLLVQYLESVARRKGTSARLVFWFDN